MQTIKLDETKPELAAKILQEGKVLAFPTETVYGLGVVYDDKNAFDKLVETKKRPPNKPFALMCSSLEEAFKYVDVSNKAKKVMEKFLPGEITVLVKAKKDLPIWVTLGTGVIGIRVPDDDYIHRLFTLVGKPCLVTSANMSGDPTSRDYAEVLAKFDGKCPAIVKGECVSNTPSTIINLANDDTISLVREGPVPFKKIEEFWRNL